MTVTLTKQPNWADVEVQSSVPTSDVTRMSVDTAGAAHIMSLLTDLYSDPELAVLREYTSNAIDSHRAAGQTRPIEVHLPAPLSPNFVVEDFGTGMSAEDIRKIYSSYGASTKRNDLDQIGAFGLGCKSALTLTQQFTLVSIKDGQRTVAHILRGADGVGEVSIISEKPTSEANGVKITIPVPDTRSFTSKAASFFHTWNSDDILIDGEKPATVFDCDHITFVPASGAYNTAHLMLPLGYYEKPASYEYGMFVMVGGIRYRVDLSASAVSNIVPAILRDMFRATMLILDIPIGSVDLVPSREAIRYSPRTLKNLEAFFAGMAADITTAVTADISKAATRAKALMRRNAWLNVKTTIFERTDFMWNGTVIPKSIKMTNLHHTGFSSSGRSKLGFKVRTSNYTDPKAEKVIMIGSLMRDTLYYTIDGRDVNKVRGYAGMFRDYLLYNNINPTTQHDLLHFVADPHDPWITGLAKHVSLDTMLADAKAYRAAQRALAPKAAAVVRDTFKYPVLSLTAGVVTWSEVAVADFEKDWYYLNLNHENFVMNATVKKYINDQGYAYYSNEKEQMAAIVALLNKAFPKDATIILVQRARSVEALTKRAGIEFPDAYPLIVKAAREMLDVSGSTQEAVIRLKHYYYNLKITPQQFVTLKDRVTEIDDPEFAGLVNLFSADAALSVDVLKTYRNIVGAQGTGQDVSAAEEALRGRIKAVVDRYPLAMVLSTDHRNESKMHDDLIGYINYTYGKANN